MPTTVPDLEKLMLKTKPDIMPREPQRKTLDLVSLTEVVSFCYFFCNLLSVSLYVVC